MTFGKYLRAERGGLLYMLAFQGLFFAIGVGMVIGINAFLNDDADFACLGTFMTLIGLLIGVLARGNTTCSGRFRMAVSMGMSRRSFLVCDPLLTVLTTLTGAFFSWALHHLEQRLYGVLYPGYENDMPMDGVFRWQVLLLLAVGLCALDLTLGAMHQKFGFKGFGVLWGLFCFGCILLPQAIANALEGGTSLIARIGAGLLWLIRLLSPAMWACVGAAVLLALLIASVLCFAKAEVRL